MSLLRSSQLRRSVQVSVSIASVFWFKTQGYAGHGFKPLVYDIPRKTNAVLHLWTRGGSEGRKRGFLKPAKKSGEISNLKNQRGGGNNPQPLNNENLLLTKFLCRLPFWHRHIVLPVSQKTCHHQKFVF